MQTLMQKHNKMVVMCCFCLYMFLFTIKLYKNSLYSYIYIFGD